MTTTQQLTETIDILKTERIQAIKITSTNNESIIVTMLEDCYRRSLGTRAT